MSVSVIIPVYNGGDYLYQAVESMLRQTYFDIEVICIDDGSTDSSRLVLESFKDPRVKVISRENKGLVATLNQGISISKYRYVARMDADDVSLPNRLEKQIRYMKKKKLAVVGCSYEYISPEGKSLNCRMMPSSILFTRFLLDFGSSLCHPSVVFDKDLLGRNFYYSETAIACEDYELWLRLSQLNVPMANVREVLFRYRVLASSVSRTLSDRQKSGSVQLLLYYSRYITDYSDAEYMLFGSVSGYRMSFVRKLWLAIKAGLNDGPLKTLFVLVYLLARR